MKFRISGVLALGLMASLATVAQAGPNLVVDGNFASPALAPGGIQTVSAGSTFGGAWLVGPGSLSAAGTGSVDVLGAGFFGTAPGGQSVDLDGTNPNGPTAGGISQTIAGLSIGSTYTLDYFYSVNPAVGSAGAKFTETFGGQTFTATVTTPGYIEYNTSFTYTGGSTLLSFVSNDPSLQQSGILIANVSLTQTTVPEPASFAMMGLGLVGVAGFARARRRTV